MRLRLCVCVGAFRDRVGAQMDWSSQPTKGLRYLTPHNKMLRP